MVGATIWMETVIRGGSSATAGAVRRGARTVAVGELGGMWRWCPRGEGVEIMELILGEIFGGRAGTGRAPALGGGGRTMLGELMCLLLGVEHHLLICPLGELSIGIEILAVRGDLALLGWVYLVRLRVSVLVKGRGIERLGVSVPSCLLLLYGVGIMVGLRRRNWRGCRRGIVRGGHALAGYGGIWCVGSG